MLIRGRAIRPFLFIRALMGTRKRTIGIILALASLWTGCATLKVDMERANHIRTGEELLELLGQPNYVREHEDGSEECTYYFKSFDLLTLRYMQYEYIYLLSQEGSVLNKSLREAITQYRLFPETELPDEFIEFK